MNKRKVLIWLSSIFFTFTIIYFSFNAIVKAETLNDNYADLNHIESKDIYYTDSYFKQSSTIYNPHIATISMVFANSTGPSGDPEDINDKKWFENQTSRLRDFFDTISYTDFDCNEDYKAPTTFSTIGVGAAKKEISDDYTVVAIAPRSSRYFQEWANNIWLGDGTKSDYMHEGWYNASNNLISFLDSYITKYVKTSKIKLWITGFSRGGAVANITAGLLDNKIDKNEKLFTSDVTLSHDDIFAYTFEAPQGANMNSKTIKKPHDKLYNNIFNIVNPNDLVPKVAMSQYGFTRFGIDKYIATEFYDNNYSSNWDVYYTLLKNIVDPKDLHPDEFNMYGFPLDFLAKGLAQKITNGNFTVLQYDNTKKNYDSNITTNLLLEELTKNIGSRNDYVNKYQEGIKNVLLKVMNYNFKFDTSNIKASLPGLITILIFGGIFYEITGSYSYLDVLVEYVNSSKIFEIPNDVLKEAIKIGIPLLKPLFKTYWNRPNELISCAKYGKAIFDNHNTEVTLAHVQAQDSFYIKNYNDKKPEKELHLVPFMDNADYGRMVLNGFNDLGLYVGNSRKINIDGHVFGKSDVYSTPRGYAAGYYSYATEEKLEIFFPLNQKYKVTFKDYSKKPYHTFEFLAYKQYFSVGPNGETKQLKSHFKDWTCFNSKRYSRDVSYL